MLSRGSASRSSGEAEPLDGIPRQSLGTREISIFLVPSQRLGTLSRGSASLGDHQRQSLLMTFLGRA